MEEVKQEVKIEKKENPILNSLRDEIRKLTSDENINFGKLNEYLRTYERLKSYEIENVDSIINYSQQY